MAREKFQTLTEQMFYILLCLNEECYGMDISKKVRTLTNERVVIGPGTLYSLLETFLNSDLIVETKVEGRRRCYQITPAGQAMLEAEYHRLELVMKDYQNYASLKGDAHETNQA